MCWITVPGESDSGPIRGESRRGRSSGQSRKRNGSQRLPLLRTLRPMPSIRNKSRGAKDQDDENACGDPKPRLTRARAAIWFDRNCGNSILNRCLRFTDQSILPPWQRPQQAGTYRTFDRTKEAVAPFRNRLNVARILDIIVQCLPQLANSYAKTAVKIDKCIFWPDMVPQFLAGDYFSGVFQKHNEKPERL